MKHFVRWGLVLALFSACCVARADSIPFAFSFSLGGIHGFGTLVTTDQGEGAFHATSGSLNVTGGGVTGTYALGAGAPGYTYSPEGLIFFDNLLFPSRNPEFDGPGLLFLGSGFEVNLLGTGANSYGILFCSTTTRHCDRNQSFFGSDFSSKQISEPATLALLSLGLVALGWRTRRRPRQHAPTAS